jgi:enamine deaminase RidA (YjgF/YER057c/UK114 family)
MPREIIQPEGIWDTRFRFAQVIKTGNTVYIAGQAASDENGNVVGKGDIKAQAEKTFSNIEKCLAAAGATMEHVVKINLYSMNLDEDLEPVSEVRMKYFKGVPIASTWVEVTRLVNPDWLLEIEAIAVID